MIAIRSKAKQPHHFRVEVRALVVTDDRNQAKSRGKAMRSAMSAYKTEHQSLTTAGTSLLLSLTVIGYSSSLTAYPRLCGTTRTSFLPPRLRIFTTSLYLVHTPKMSCRVKPTLPATLSLKAAQISM